MKEKTVGGPMKKLFVDKTIEINAPSSKVWNVITAVENTAEWAPAFTGGAPFRIESDWVLGSPVLWKNEDGSVVVEGNVTGLDPNKLLRYTVFDVNSPERPAVTEEDGITFTLSENEGVTLLHILQGDFSVMTEGEKYRDASAAIWDQVLVKVKQLAEK
jgi:uncharacterized protein YndB with AHSA1/START domain